MTTSLRRTLAVRFAATMAAGLLVATAAFYWAATQTLPKPVLTNALETDLLLALGVIVVCGTAATLIGAWHFTTSAVRPVAEITAQAEQIEAGTLDQRIVAHADTEEYQGLVAVLNRMLERLERGFTAQRRFTADMSHELRTPLTALRGEIEVALRAERSPRDYELVLRSALEEIEQLTTLSEDLLLVTRADAHLLTPRRESVDVGALVERLLEAQRVRVAERDLRVRRELDDGVAASVDPELFERLVGHLIENAVTYTPMGGAVMVRVTRDAGNGRGVRLVVENAGMGIDAADLPHIFEPFYRCDPARTRGQEGCCSGPGLGLALVAAIARLHGGTVRASSEPGRGTRFEVEVPAVSNN